MKKIATALLLTGLVLVMASVGHAKGSKATADLNWFVNFVDATNPTLDEVFDTLDYFPWIEEDVDVYGPFVALPTITRFHQEYTVSNLVAYIDEHGHPVWYYEIYTLVYYPSSRATGPAYCEIYIHSDYAWASPPITRSGQ